MARPLLFCGQRYAISYGLNPVTLQLILHTATFRSNRGHWFPSGVEGEEQLRGSYNQKVWE